MADSQPPVVTVLLATHGRPELLLRALESMAAQTLSRDRFEVVVVLNGPADDSPRALANVASRHLDLRLRTVRSTRPGVAAARTIGLHAARGEQMTILDDDDWVSPDYLAALVEAASPGVVPLAWLADVPADPVAEASFDNYYSTALTRAAARGAGLAPVSALPQAISLNVGKLVPVSVARAVGYDESLRGGSDFVFWTSVFARDQFLLRLPTDRRAVYYRSTGHGSLSRQDVGHDFSVRQRLACIGSLESLPHRPRVAETLTRHMVRAQLRLVRTFLDRHPDRRASVTAEVEAGRFARTDWSVLNRDAAEDLALLYCFPPWVDTSGLVGARRIRERGVLVDVVCQDLGALRDRDPTSELIAAPYVGRRHAVPGPAAFSDWDAVTRWSRGVFGCLERWGKDHRSVYSRAMWAASHLVAAQYKLRNPGVPWIAELSDPISRTVRGRPRPGRMVPGPLVRELRTGLRTAGFADPTDLRTFAWAERVAYAFADELVFTNENQRDYMLGYCPDPALADRARSVARVLPHPTPEPQLYAWSDPDYPLDPDRVQLAYFGNFYVTRGLTEVTDALASLPGAVRSRIRLHVFTKDPAALRADALAAGLADVVVANPYVGFLDFLALTRRFDVLVVNDADTSSHGDGPNPYLPSKLADYLGSGTSIWAVVEPGSVLSRIELTHRTRLGDVPAATAVLEALVAARFEVVGR